MPSCRLRPSGRRAANGVALLVPALLLLCCQLPNTLVEAQTKPAPEVAAAAAAADPSAWIPRVNTATAAARQQPFGGSGVTRPAAGSTAAAAPIGGMRGNRLQPAAMLPRDAAAGSGLSPIGRSTSTSTSSSQAQRPLLPAADSTMRPAGRPPGKTGLPAAAAADASQSQGRKAGAAAGAVGAAGATAAAGTKAGSSPGKKPAAAAAAAATANPPGSLHNLLAKNTPLFRSLFTVLDISPDDIPPAAVGTVLAPSDDAVSEFLESMGLTAAQLAARPELVDLMLSYHFVPGYQLQGDEDVTDGGRVLLTGDEQYFLRAVAAPKGGSGGGGPSIKDVQRSQANIVEGPMIPKDAGSISVFVIDKVLKSANYFTSIEAALTHSPYWIDAKSFVKRSGLLPQLEGKPLTLLIPDSAAFKPLEAKLSRASTGRVAELLSYHVLPKVRRVPRGFQSGTLDTLLKGHTLEVNATSTVQKDTFSGKNVSLPIVTFTSEAGSRPSKVNFYNIFAGPAILQGVTQLLLPDLPPDLEEQPEDPPDDDLDLDDPAVGVAEEAGPAAAGAAGRTGAGTAAGAAGRAGAGPAQPVTRGIGSSRSASSSAGPGAAASVGARGISSSTGRSVAGTTASRPLGRGAPAAAPDPDASPEAGGLDDGGRRRRLLLLQLLPPPTQRLLSAGLQAARRLLMSGRTLHASTQLRRGGSSPVASSSSLGPARPITAVGSSATAAGTDTPTLSGALSSTVNKGDVGELQTFANGINTNKTVAAFALAANGSVPKQYVNRYGFLKGPLETGGCLNCKAWGTPQQ